MTDKNGRSVFPQKKISNMGSYAEVIDQILRPNREEEVLLQEGVNNQFFQSSHNVLINCTKSNILTLFSPNMKKHRWELNIFCPFSVFCESTPISWKWTFYIKGPFTRDLDQLGIYFMNPIESQMINTSYIWNSGKSGSIYGSYWSIFRPSPGKAKLMANMVRASGPLMYLIRKRRKQQKWWWIRNCSNRKKSQ